jgi:tetratricopeptide (TPR) repeat protein
MVDNREGGRADRLSSLRFEELIRLSTGHFRAIGIYVAVAVIVVPAMVIFASLQVEAQTAVGMAGIDGYARDSAGKPVADITVLLKLESAEPAVAAATQITHTDAKGYYRFAGLATGTYTVRGEMPGYIRAIIAGMNVSPNRTTKVDLVLKPSGASETAGSSLAASASKSDSSRPEFFDEPQFTVAGVTQASNSGGHGSDTVLRSSEALAKATVSLSKEPSKESIAAETSTATSERSLLDGVANHPNDSEAHHRLADSEEKLGHALGAVREYQRAAELDPSERNLFDWGTELLAHRALEPAGEVFTKGNRLYPKSVRMLIALGVSWYARGSYDQATDCLIRASDLAPDDATPYLFLGKMVAVAAPLEQSEKSVERLARFARLQPDNALANYYYAVGLAKQFEIGGEHDQQLEQSERLEALLRKAVRLDPKLGAAYLQLGIVYSQRADFSAAISAYRKAIEVYGEGSGARSGNSSEKGSENDETVGEAHYRLAQAYSRIGEKGLAQEELQLHSQIVKRTKDDEQRKLRETQEFVFSIREKNTGLKPPN